MSEPEKLPTPPTKSSRAIVYVFAGLILWALIIAFGAFQTPASTDYRRPLIVIAVMGFFLGVWWWALRAKRIKSQSNA
ncbi:hypothetical protein N9B41_01285 [bacterium]|jgi:hypothetical protein|nr:hypothetical protein [Mariniblastus sp.]MDA7911967.1 hypothetical protein [bacterium]MDA7906090.1 hypothetical protein [Mariniblastus sp.]MDA7925809.1 hypothetical protein [Mariniblastus sp.]MDB4367905.1 hypothetical protein [Mariniblastus sp.]